MQIFVLTLLLVISPFSFASESSIHYQPGYARACTEALIASNAQFAEDFVPWNELKAVVFSQRGEFESALVLKVDAESLLAYPLNAEEMFGLLVAPGLLRLPEFNSFYQGQMLSVVYGPTSSWLKFAKGVPEIRDATLVRPIDLKNTDDPLAQKVAVALNIQRRNFADREQNLSRIQKILVQFNGGRRLSEKNGLRNAVFAIADRVVRPERLSAVREMLEAKSAIGPDDGLRFTFAPAALAELRQALIILGHELNVSSDSVSNFAFEAKVLDRAALRGLSGEK